MNGICIRRDFLRVAAVVLVAAALYLSPSPSAGAQTQGRTPNVIFMYADDLGYGDLGVYGSRIPTPQLDRMAHQGVRFLQFYSASPVCSPSRAALLTGRYPTRVGVPTVLFPDSQTGLVESETTIAEMLKAVGYRTMCIGKWHLGSMSQFLPTRRGFDEFYGLPYSHDMSPLPLLHNTEVIEEPAKIDTLTLRYTEQAVNFIARAKDSPFFLYIAYSMPHVPLASSAQFRGKSAFGPYGDAVEEIDWSVGQVLNALKENGIDDRTLVMFSSDNGPWYQGSPSRFRGRKGETWEGGVREPFIARFPGQIPRGHVSYGIATTMDILPTLARLCNAPLPRNPLDGVDIWPLLEGRRDEVERDALLYFDYWNIQCARLGRWKLHVARYNSAAWSPDPPGGRINLPLPRPELYDVEADPGESYDVAQGNPDIVAQILSRIQALLFTFPEQVQDAWRATTQERVEDTYAGALPKRKSP